jgi:uncharacterized protein
MARKRVIPQKSSRTPSQRRTGSMTVREAGHLGGSKGGQRVKELIEEGKERERSQSR